MKMHCNDAEKLIDTLSHNLLHDEKGLMRHLALCNSCHDYTRERQLIELLASLPVPESSTGYEERVMAAAIREKRPAVNRLHAYWAISTAASVLLAVVLTLQFHSAGTRDQAEIVQDSVVEVQPGQPRIVNVLLNSPRLLNDALMALQWDENLELRGYEGVKELRWQTTLKDGNNKLSLPIQLTGGESGTLTVTVEHGGARKHFSVLVNAAPSGRESSSQSMQDPVSI